MTDYDWDYGPYTPPAKYDPHPSWDQILEFQELNDYIFSFEASIDHLIRDRIREDLARGRSGLNVGLLYDIMEYMNDKFCYK